MTSLSLASSTALGSPCGSQESEPVFLHSGGPMRQDIEPVTVCMAAATAGRSSGDISLGLTSDRCIASDHICTECFPGQVAIESRYCVSLSS
jgi:hypothetical protein